MRPLPFAFYLAPPLIPAVVELTQELRHRTGIEIAFDPAATYDDRRRQLDEGDAAIAWVCGLETLLRVDAGTLDVEIVAAPVFHGQSGPVYHSVIIVREDHHAATIDDLAGAILAINEPGSWSGNHALRAHLLASGRSALRFGRVLVTGGHAASIRAVSEGLADVAAIDHTVWAVAGSAGETGSLRALDRTSDWPAPPFSISRTLDRDIRAALRDALVSLTPAGLDRIVPATADDYEPMRTALRAMHAAAT